MKFDSKTKIYVYQKPIDMRFGFERLSYLIKEEMGKDIDVGDVFIFLGNNRRRLNPHSALKKCKIPRLDTLLICVGIPPIC